MMMTPVILHCSSADEELGFNVKTMVLTCSTRTYTDKGLGFVVRRIRVTLAAIVIGWPQFITTVMTSKRGTTNFLKDIKRDLRSSSESESLNKPKWWPSNRPSEPRMP